ncbi:MAG: hypothetical protein WBV06_02490 [Acidimicrobiia bacterium]
MAASHFDGEVCVIGDVPADPVDDSQVLSSTGWVEGEGPWEAGFDYQRCLSRGARRHGGDVFGFAFCGDASRLAEIGYHLHL